MSHGRIPIALTTGTFENQITDTEASGNQFNGQESIIIPDSTNGAHFIVSTLPSAKFLNAYPNQASLLGSTDSIEIFGLAAAPGRESSYSSQKTMTIPIGSFREATIITTPNSDGTFSVTFGNSTVTIDSLILELDSYNAARAIKTQDAYQGLRDKLIAVKIKLQNNLKSAANNQLKAFQNQLKAGDLVKQFALQPLLRDSQTLINALK